MKMALPLALICILLVSCDKIAEIINPPPAPDPSPADVDAEFALLEVIYTPGETAGTVKHDVILPTTLGRGVKAAWASGNPAVVSAQGHVTRPITGTDAVVALTATLSKGTATRDKSFLLVVISIPPAADHTPPGEVTNTQVIAGNSSLSLTWTDPTDADFNDVVVSVTGHSPQVIPKGTGTATVSGLANNQAYTVSVRTEDTSGNTSSGVTVTGTPVGPDSFPPAEVTNIETSGGESSVTLTWTDPTDSDFAAVEIVGNSTTISVSKGVQTYTVTSLVDGTTYHFLVRTVDSFGNRSDGLPVSAIPVDLTPPGAVTGVHAAPHAGQVVLTWTNPTDADLAGVTVSGQGFSSFNIVGTTATVGGLSNSVSYTFVLTAYDQAGNHAPGVQVSAAPDGTPPGPVTGLAVTPGDGAITLTWTNPVDADLALVELGGVGSWAAVPGQSMSETVGGLTNGTNYSFNIRTIDTAGNASGWTPVTGKPFDPTVGGGTVNLDPQIPVGLALTSNLTSVTVAAGAFLNLWANGNLILDSVQWYRNGRALSGETNTTYSAYTTGWAPGAYQLTLVATSGTQTASVTFPVTVTP